MRTTEAINYGSIEDFNNVGCLLEFYDRLGLTSRFNPEDICHVDQLRISEKDHRRLRDLIQAEVQRREPHLIGRIRNNTARTDWFNRAPLPSNQIPEGELWVDAKEFLTQKQDTIEKMTRWEIFRGGCL
ncbi:hypothetical protein [Oscillibacter sp. GMB15532]|uniref:hypothetical protein n=1 Tax=Oscillibacter sp. GMB15532 TaxID=3230022 RepID=UPI0034DF4DA5